MFAYLLWYSSRQNNCHDMSRKIWRETVLSLSNFSGTRAGTSAQPAQVFAGMKWSHYTRSISRDHLREMTPCLTRH